VRLIDQDGKQLGIFPTKEALKNAEEQGFDLVEVAPTANPPVCKIMDYGKYRYQMSKRHSSRHKTMEVKEVKVRPQISKHDLDFKIRNIKRFLEQGNKVKITMLFRGREIVYSSLAKGVFDRISEGLTGKVNIEQMPKLEGRQMIMILSAKS
jgi:translation initiation factor IF-3